MTARMHVNTTRSWAGLALLLLFALGFQAPACFAAEKQQITPSHVYQLSFQSINELNLILKDRQLKPVNPPLYFASAQPRHVLQKSYEVIGKINILKQQLGLQIDLPERQYIGAVKPSDVYKNAQSIVDAILAIKAHYGITARAKQVEVRPGKIPADVFKNMDTLNQMMDVLIGANIKPTDVYSLASLIVENLGNFYPAGDKPFTAQGHTKFSGKRPRDVYNLAFQLLTSLKQLIQKNNYSLEGGIAFPPRKRGHVTPSDVIDVLEIIVADVEAIAHGADIRIKHTVSQPDTPKTPSDVYTALLQADNIVKGLLTQ